MKTSIFTCFIGFVMNLLPLFHSAVLSLMRSVRFSRVLTDTRPIVRTRVNGTGQVPLSQTVCVLIAVCFSVSLFLSDANAQTQPPSAPRDVRVTAVSTTALEVTWTEPADFGDGITLTGSDVRHRPGTTGSWTSSSVLGVNIPPESRSYTITGLQAGTPYQVQVRASNVWGQGPWSDPVTGTTNGLPALAAPTVTALTTTSLQVTWTAPSNPVIDYNVEYRQGSSGAYTDANYDGTVPTTDITGLNPGTLYQVRVQAEVGVLAEGILVSIGYTEWSAPGRETTLDVPDAPAAPMVSAVDGTTDQLRVTWTAPTNTGGADITDYDVQYRLQGSTGGYTDVPHTGTSTMTTITTGLVANTQYEVQVRATNSAGPSPWSPAGTGTTNALAPTVPAAPAAPTVSAEGTTSLRVTWTEPHTGGAPIIGYDIQYRMGSDAWSSITDITTPHTLPDLLPDTTYEVQVRATNSVGPSGWSPSGTGTTGAPPLSPSSALTVTFADYPEERPTETFQLTIRFSQPVTGFRPDDITIETELKTGSGNPTVESLTPTGPARTYTATIQLPPRTTGTLKLIVRARAANSTTSEATGPATATASDPIDFGRRRVYLYPSPVAMDTIIFNEFRNAADDKNDWVELKNVSDEPVPLKEWEVSLVLPHAISAAASHVERAAMDRDVVEFPEYTLPPGGVLLIVNTDPSENDLIHGQNIADPHHNPALFPQYIIAPELRLPDTPYLLILRSTRDKNGAWDGFEDLLGNYHKGDVSYRTQIWPLRDTWVYTGTGAHLSDAEVYERVMIERVTSLSFRSRLVPEKRGYLRGAWVPSEVRSGLGYRPGVSLDTALGTPGYPTPLSSSEVGTGHITISEVMFATNERGSPAQWIELYNNSTTEIVNLEGYQVRIEIRDHQPVHRHITFPLKSIEIMPRQTVLLVSRKDRASENIPARRIYDAQRQLRRSPLLRAEGFSVRLLSPDEMLVDRVGNLDGKVGRDEPRWALPSGFTETGKRSSLIRRYEDGVPWQGTVPMGWVRASATSLLGPLTYYGLSTDDGTPGYRQGSPLPVTLSSFRADLRDGSVVLNWTTASEMENAGFYVLRRRDQASDFVQINPTLILGAGTTAERQTYTYRDTTAQENVAYHYRLEEVSLSGERRAIATVRMRGHLSAVGKSLWKWADVKKSED